MTTHMNRERFAARLNGREYREELNPAEEREAAADGLVVIFGASDDLVELRGAINDELGAIDGGTILIADNGTLLPDLERDDIDILKKYGVLSIVQERQATAKTIEALWCQEPPYSWTYRTDIPHSTFDVMEDGELYCRGIVIDLKEL